MSPLSPSQALQHLLDGNDRFLSGDLRVQQVTASDLAKHSEHQQPFAIVLTCSDSRVPVERVFDVGLGQIFVVRVAGNIVSPEVLGSIEFGVNVLRAPLVLVMGHSDCGAIRGALNRQHAEMDSESPLRHLLEAIAEGIIPGDACAEEITFARAVSLNVQHQVDALRRAAVLRPALHDSSLWVVGAYYEIMTGMVRLLEHKGAEVGLPTHDAED